MRSQSSQQLASYRYLQPQLWNFCRQNDFEVAGVLGETYFDLKFGNFRKNNLMKKSNGNQPLPQPLKVWLFFLKHCFYSEVDFLLRSQCLQVVYLTMCQLKNKLLDYHACFCVDFCSTISYTCWKWLEGLGWNRKKRNIKEKRILKYLGGGEGKDVGMCTFTYTQINTNSFPL